MFDEVQKYKSKFYKFDLDSSPEVYALYEKIYTNEIGDKYCISNPKIFRYDPQNKGYIDVPYEDSVNRLYALQRGTSYIRNITIKNNTYEIYNAVERLSGDCFFNFNSKKINELKKIRGIDMKRLEKCESMHHSIYNMVLLQTMGNMQKRKQQGLILPRNEYEQLDRGDTFLYFLNKFYYEDDEEILKASTKSNKNTLKEYLKSNFHDVYDYSDKMLQIDDENFINKLIKNGEKKLDSTLVNDYLDMAIRFWGKRKEKIDPMID